MSGRKQFNPDVAITAAVRIFWERGYSAVSIADLQRAMGIGRASLYDTYGGKEKLFLRALDAYVATHGPPVAAAFAAHESDAIAAMGAIFDAAIARMNDPALPAGCLIAHSAAEIGALAPASRTAVSKLVASQISSIQKAFDSDLVAGRLRPDTDVDTLAVYLAGTIHALSIMHSTGTPTATICAVVTYVMTGLEQHRSSVRITTSRAARRPSPPTWSG